MSVTPFPDAGARERIRTDLLANLCVEAGAGTGKTTVLVDRLVEILRTGHATVDEIAVITFTDAAAAELAGRVREALEAARADAGDRAQTARLVAALRNLPQAHIQTIHAFAAGMLAERPVEARIDPRFEQRDEVGAQLGFEAAYATWLADILAGDHPEVTIAVNRGLDLARLRDLVTAVHVHRALLPLTHDAVPVPTPDAFLARLRSAVGEFVVLAADCVDDDAGRAAMAAVTEWSRRLAAAAADPRALERELLLRSPAIQPNAGSQAGWSEPASCRRSKELRREIKEALDDLQAALRGEAVLRMLPIAERFVADYAAARRGAGVADFDDLLIWARDLVRESAEARAYFRRRYRVILVDEFQDTDPVQTELVLLIASDDEPGADWLAMTPRPGALTVVGDPKQSIYRFRRADIAMYDALRHGPLADGVVALVQNFRSVRGVLDWVNPVFDRAFVAQPGVQPPNVHLVHGHEALADESRSVVVVHGDPDGPATSDIRAREAELLAATIRRIVEEGWPVRARHGEGERPARFGDVAVLMPRRTDLSLYLAAFRRAGVPVRATGGRSFFARQEVRDLSSLLRAVDNPRDRIAVVGALRSALIGCSDEELFLHVDAGGRLDYLATTPPGPPAVVGGLGLLRDLHDLRTRVSLDELVRAVLERTRAIEIALMDPDGVQAAANLRKLAGRAQGFDATRTGGLQGFARWLTDRAAAPDEEEAGTDEETDDVVRVMTIHGAKGLEFPIVALANLGARGSTTTEPVPDRVTRRLELQLGAKTSGFATPGFPSAWARETARRDAEDTRLLYVALTRARDRLVIPCVAGDAGPAGLLAQLAPAIPGWNPVRAETSVDGCFLVHAARLPTAPVANGAGPGRPDPARVAAALAARAEWDAARSATITAARAESVVRSATADADRAPAAWSDGEAGLAPVAPPPAGRAAAKGEALHTVLEVVDLDDHGDLGALVASVCADAGLDHDVTEILALARACLASDALVRARAGDGIWREVPYVLAAEDGYRTGRIDLVFREGDALSVIDWKSDAVGPGDVTTAAQGHRAQAEAYARALRATTGLPVREVAFVFPRAPGEAWVTVSAA